jgi:predicted PurR-regulated permease PerM
MEIPPPSQLDAWTFKRVMWATLVLVLVALGFWVLFKFNGVLFTVFVAIVMGTVIRPMVDWLNRRGFSRLAGTVLAYFLILAFIISFLFLLFPLIARQGTTIVAEVPGYYQSLRNWIVNSPIQLLSQLGQFLPYTILGQTTVQQTGEQALASAGQALGYVAIAANGIFMATAIVLLAFHWTIK